MRQGWRIIFVNDRPYRVWHTISVMPTSEFLQGVSYDYFSLLADMYEEQLAQENAWAAKLALRTTYGQALEAFFAVLFATLQAPFDPAAWLLLYRPGDIVKLLKRFESGKELPSCIQLPEPRSWNAMARLFHPLELQDVDSPDQVISDFSVLWQELSAEMQDPIGSAEYNSLKHGFRAKASGHSLSSAAISLSSQSMERSFRS
jgi:hypothetical protein